MRTHSACPSDERNEVAADRQENEDYVEIDWKSWTTSKGQRFLGREKEEGEEEGGRGGGRGGGGGGGGGGGVIKRGQASTYMHTHMHKQFVG